jgi:hypothetical protein
MASFSRPLDTACPAFAGHARSRTSIRFWRDPIRTLFWQEPMMRVGAETMTFGGVAVLVTSSARTVGDMLHYRGKLGD